MIQQRRGLLLVMMAPPGDFEDKFNRWYNEEHISERLRVPGFLSCRRFVAVEGRHKYLALYDLESPDVLRSDEYATQKEQPSPWTEEVLKHVPMTRNEYVEITPDIPDGYVPQFRPVSEL